MEKQKFRLDEYKTFIENMCKAMRPNDGWETLGRMMGFDPRTWSRCTSGNADFYAVPCDKKPLLRDKIRLFIYG